MNRTRQSSSNRPLMASEKHKAILRLSPPLCLYLQERCNAERKPREEILPSAQMLLLHFIYEGARELSTSQAAKDLELTPTSISRASKQLEEMGLLHIKKLGVQRILQSEDSPKMLFQKAGDKLLNPVKRTVYIPKELVGTDLLESGYSALAECFILNVPLEEFEEFKSHSLSVRTPSGRKTDLKQAPVRGLGTPNGGIVVFDKTSGEAMNIMPKSSAHVTLCCQDE